MIKKLFSTITAQRSEERRAELYRNLIRHEARIGGQLFGPVPAGARREFFCLDEHTWVWHEEWLDNKSGERKTKTTRYDVRPDSILKSQNGQYQHLTPDEGRRLLQAAETYRNRVKAELYTFAA